MIQIFTGDSSASPALGTGQLVRRRRDASLSRSGEADRSQPAAGGRLGRSARDRCRRDGGRAAAAASLHVLWMHGPADAIARDTILKGTALSAPVSNLLVQAALTAVVARRPSQGAARALGGLGALQVAGYLGERLVRRRLRPSAGTLWSRRCSSPASDWRGRWPHSAGRCSSRTGLSGRRARSGPAVAGVVAGRFAKARSTAACRTSRSARARLWSCSPD
jgi:hypothetical protein